MGYHCHHNRHHPPNKPHPAKTSSIKGQYYPQRQTKQKRDLDEESETDFGKPPPSLVKNLVSVIREVKALVGAITSFTGMIVILNIAQAGSRVIAAVLFALLIGGMPAIEIVFHALKQKVL